MKKYLLTIILTFALTAAVSAETIRTTVNGMVCGFCATAIEKTFKRQPEVKTVEVDLKSRLVTVTTKEGQTLDDAKVKKLMTNTGYSVVNIDRVK
jgi:mercuric ion binding protein